MKTFYVGKAHLFGKNIDTDQIYPGQYLELVEPEDVAQHCLEGADPEFASRVQPCDIVVAGTNFGCGSSREHAAIALKHAGVAAVVAESFARIFYRNAINLALPLLVCKGIAAQAASGDTLELDLVNGTVRNTRTGKVLEGEKLSPYAMNILDKGGIKAIFLEKTRKSG
ncbi:3-isopropylmalate dehydratase small subunit [Marispirochaeta sp.]|jgi:3-isopropylmalate/(R)-2-methylmalate dehydratase small subunit|uniref:3-isopropylmalate dehydratase small subunit n=1 Tax=Marispirochaeta sp. TaxID=2038653 RepID=UPI0029C78769|nr:3-isopropylmalate dehydratase small subunit [Marispirochaeta sp.]